MTKSNLNLYDDCDLDAAVEYASELAEKYTEAELFDVLSELSFTPVQCQQAITKLKESKQAALPLQQCESCQPNQNYDNGLLYLVWLPFGFLLPFLVVAIFIYLIWTELLPIFLSQSNLIIDDFPTMLFDLVTNLLWTIYQYLTPFFLAGIIFSANKPKILLKISSSIILIFLIIGYLDFLVSL